MEKHCRMEKPDSDVTNMIVQHKLDQLGEKVEHDINLKETLKLLPDDDDNDVYDDDYGDQNDDDDIDESTPCRSRAPTRKCSPATRRSKRTKVLDKEKDVTGKDNFLKAALLENSLCIPLRDVMKIELDRQHVSFEKFLNTHQHEIYHMCFSTNCCCCTSTTLTSHSGIIINESHLNQLFDQTDRLSCHKKKGNIYCCRRAKKDINIETINTYLICALLHTLCIRVFWYFCLDVQGVSIEQLLKYNTHKIFHTSESNHCCQCKPEDTDISKKSNLSKADWNLLFNQSNSPCDWPHRKKSVQECSCCWRPRTGIQVEKLTLELQKTILDIVCKEKNEIRSVMDALFDIYRYSGAGTIHTRDFIVILEKLASVINIANHFENKKYEKKHASILESQFDENYYQRYLLEFRGRFSTLQKLILNLTRLETNTFGGRRKKTAKEERKGKSSTAFLDKSVQKKFGTDVDELHSEAEMNDHCSICSNEEPELLHSFCISHDLLLCQICSQIHHKCKPRDLKDVTKGEITIEKISHIKKRINNVSECMDNLIPKLEKEDSLIQNKKDVFLKSIEDTKKNLSVIIDDFKEKGLRNIEDYMVEMKKLTTLLPKLKKSVNDSNASLSIGLYYRKKGELCVALPNIEKELQKDETTLLNLQDKGLEIFEPVVKLETLSKQTFQIVFDPRNRQYKELSSISKTFAANTFRHIKDMQVEESCAFEIPNGNEVNQITGCTILSDGQMCFIDSKNSRLVLRNADGFVNNFQLQLIPYDVTAISISEVAVLHKSSVAIVNVEETVSTEFKFRSVGKFRFITFYKPHLIVCVSSCCFLVINLQGQIVREIKIAEDLVSCLSCWNDKIFYANRDKNRICSVDLQSGESKFVMDVDKIAKSPTGIASDGNGNIIIVGSSNNNIVVISVGERKGSKELIRGITNVNYPKATAYNASNRRLLICSPKGQAVVYSLR